MRVVQRWLAMTAAAGVPATTTAAVEAAATA